MKTIYIKPGLYTLFYQYLKEIAQEYGYNLVVNGSMNRDLDLIAIPWVDNPKSEQDMVKEFQQYLKGCVTTDPQGKVPYTILPGNRHSYIIDLNRGDKHGEWVRFSDQEYYLDISVIQLTNNQSNDKAMTELEKKYEELVVYLKALTISHSPDEKYENRLLAEITALKEQQGSKEQLLDWAYKMGLLLDKKIPFMGHDNLQRIEIAVRSYAQQSEVTDEMIRCKALSIVGFDKTSSKTFTQEMVVNFILVFAKWHREQINK